MKIRSCKSSQQKQSQINTKECVDIIEAMLHEIGDYEEDNQDNPNYHGILSERTGSKIRKTLPELAKKYGIYTDY